MMPSNTSQLQKPKTVAVVVPTHYERLDSDQQISFRHLEHHLGRHKKYLVMPESLPFERPGFEIRRFDDRHFQTIKAYDHFMFSQEFYQTFIDYQYILIYQFDCLVFSDQLLEWCETGFDYIGAPWFRSKSDPEKGFSRVGNGGLSLRKVRSFVKVIESKRYTQEPVSYLKDLCLARPPDLGELPGVKRILKRLSVLHDAQKGVDWYMTHYTLNEDHFWSDRAKLFYPDFKIAPVDVALRFSFEGFPRYCFDQNNRRLPFGCHGWVKKDRGFWAPYLLT
jgi:hypothetical protein